MVDADEWAVSSLLRRPLQWESTARSQGSSVTVFPAVISSLSLRSIAKTNVVSLRGAITASDSMKRSTRTAALSDLEIIKFKSTHGPFSNSQ